LNLTILNGKQHRKRDFSRYKIACSSPLTPLSSFWDRGNFCDSTADYFWNEIRCSLIGILCRSRVKITSAVAENANALPRLID
jgi:hypothetical protein